MEETKPSKLDRIKKFVRENQGPITFGVGMGVGAVVGATYPEFFVKPKARRYPWGSSYNPAQPIPTLLLSEEEIKREIVSGILAAEFLKERKLTGDIMEWAREWLDDFRDKMDTSELSDFEVLTRVSQIRANM